MGNDSPIKYIVLQVHYATVDKFTGMIYCDEHFLRITEKRNNRR